MKIENLQVNIKINGRQAKEIGFWKAKSIDSTQAWSYIASSVGKPLSIQISPMPHMECQVWIDGALQRRVLTDPRSKIQVCGSRFDKDLIRPFVIKKRDNYPVLPVSEQPHGGVGCIQIEMYHGKVLGNAAYADAAMSKNRDVGGLLASHMVGYRNPLISRAKWLQFQKHSIRPAYTFTFYYRDVGVLQDMGLEKTRPLNWLKRVYKWVKSSNCFKFCKK